MSEAYTRHYTGVILCGGLGRRLEGRDKGLVPFRGRPLVEHALERLAGQVGSVVINANRNAEIYRGYGWPVVGDGNDAFNGPLSGVLSAMDVCETAYLVCVPCDAPFLSEQLVERFDSIRSQSPDVVCAHDGSRLQPTFAMVAKRCAPQLETYLQQGGRKIDTFYNQLAFHTVDFSDQPESFANLNRDEDFSRLS